MGAGCNARLLCRVAWVGPPLDHVGVEPQCAGLSQMQPGKAHGATLDGKAGFCERHTCAGAILSDERGLAAYRAELQCECGVHGSNRMEAGR